MLRFVVGRLIATIPVIFVVALAIFLLVRLAPGDPAVLIAGDNATPQQLEIIRANLGLDQPLIVQFGKWLGQIAAGDLGTSIMSQTPVGKIIADRIGPTLSLAFTTIALSVLVAVPLGVLAAARHGTAIDRIVIAICVIGFSVPVFVIGYTLMLFFSIEQRWLPVQGFRGISEGIAPFARYIVLPTVSLSVLYIALIARITRASLLEVLNEDFIRTARAKGVSETKVLVKHALRNVTVPVITVIGISFALMLGGVVITESVFNIPGLGRLTVDAVMGRDYPVIQALTLLSGLFYVLVNLLIDLAYVLLDPRVRYE
ncbi:ABC transporter permease [Agrobacterium sp. NPDC089420]|uniref:ABC transporter permease n=1 Tax=Agrobacterium sp. NPDC089420 TaxID=3363918 RepID=UPI00384A6676